MTTVGTDTKSSDAVRLQFLGTPAIWVGPQRHELDRHLAALMLMLAVEGPTPRAHAAATLWPDVDAKRGRNSLRQRLHRIKQFGVSTVVGQTILSLDPDITTDLEVSAIPPGVPYGIGPNDLLGTVNFNDADLLSEWVESIRTQWRNRRVQWLEQEAERLEAELRLTDAINCLMAAIDLEPLSERIYRTAMRLHYRLGDGAIALQLCERLEGVLRDTLGKALDAETQQLAQLIHRSTLAVQRQTESPVTLQRPPRLVGRDGELAWVSQLWRSGTRVLLTGEAGIGKSRFIEALLLDHRGLQVAARPSDVSVPFALLARFIGKLVAWGTMPAAWIRTELADIFPDFGEPRGSPSAVRMQRAMAAWLKAPEFLEAHLCIEDLHFADDATLEMVVALSLDPDGPNWLLSCRDGELSDLLVPVRHAIGEGSGFTAMTLQPLNMETTAQLVDSLNIAGFDVAEWAAPLFRRTGGRPLFVLETLRHVLEKKIDLDRFDSEVALAPSLLLMLQGRLARLSSEALRLARVFAVAEADFHAELATHLLQCNTLDLVAPLTELEGAQIINGSGFAHDLIQAAIVMEIPALVAEALHRQIAEWLEPHGAPSSRVAQHWEAARMWAEAGAALEKAGDQAVNANRVREGEQLWLRSLAAYERANQCDGMVNALCALVRLALIRASLEDADRWCDRLQAIATTERNRRYALHLMADTALRAQDFDRAAQFATELLAIAEAIRDEEAAFNARRKLAGALAYLDRGDEAVAIHHQMSKYAQGREAHQSVRVYFCDRGVVLELAGDARRAEASLREAIDHNLRHNDRLLARRTFAHLAGNLWRRGLTTQAIEPVVQARQLTEQLELSAEQSLPDSAERQALMRDAADMAAAWNHLQQISPLVEAHPTNALVSLARTHVATTWLRLGRFDQATRLLTDEPSGRLAAVAAAHRWLALVELHRWRRRAIHSIPAWVVDLADQGPWMARTIASLARLSQRASKSPGQSTDAVAEQAQSRGLDGIALHAKVLGLADLRAAAVSVRRAMVARILAEADHVDPYLMYKPELWWRCVCTLAAVDEYVLGEEPTGRWGALKDATATEPLIRRALLAAAEWIRRASDGLPAEMQNSFLSRNPVNADVLRLGQFLARIDGAEPH